MFTATGVWLRKVYGVLQRVGEAIDYKYEDYAEERFKKMERRLAALEDHPRR
jgi:hypothetical protein